MGTEIFVGRKQLAETVAPETPVGFSARRVVTQFVPVDVALVVRTPVMDVSENDDRYLTVVDASRQGHLFPLRNHLRFGRIFPAAEVIFQQGVHAVQRSAGGVSRHMKRRAVGINHETVRAERLRFGRIPGCPVRRAENDFAGHGRLGIGHHRQIGLRNTKEISSETFCRQPREAVGVGSHHDAVVAAAAVGQADRAAARTEQQCCPQQDPFRAAPKGDQPAGGGAGHHSGRSPITRCAGYSIKPDLSSGVKPQKTDRRLSPRRPRFFTKPTGIRSVSPWPVPGG